MVFICFFFQAEDGIRDLTVTGVQTCALPISIGAQRDRQIVPKGRQLEAAHFCQSFISDVEIFSIIGNGKLRRPVADEQDRKSTRLNSSHSQISYAVFCLKKKKKT